MADLVRTISLFPHLGKYSAEVGLQAHEDYVVARAESEAQCLAVSNLLRVATIEDHDNDSEAHSGPSSVASGWSLGGFRVQIDLVPAQFLGVQKKYIKTSVL